MSVERLYRKYKNKFKFYFVYIREAHPSDGDWPDFEIPITDAKDEVEREGAAKSCSESLKFSFPTLVDDMSDSVNLLYSAWPERLFFIDQGGQLLFKSGLGPHGFSTDELGAFISSYLVAGGKNR